MATRGETRYSNALTLCCSLNTYTGICLMRLPSYGALSHRVSTVRLIINLNATVTSRLQAETAT